MNELNILDNPLYSLKDNKSKSKFVLSILTRKLNNVNQNPKIVKYIVKGYKYMKNLSKF